MSETEQKAVCPYAKKCGGCMYQGKEYAGQLAIKQAQVGKLFRSFCTVRPILGAQNPYYYRNKVHAVYGYVKGSVVSGIYQANSHRLIPVESCQIENQQADQIIMDIRGLLVSFKIKTYDEDTGYGFFRHVLIRTGKKTGQILVVLVVHDPIFPSKRNFTKALKKLHPEITSIVMNINPNNTNMVLGSREEVLYGPGYIEDELCGCRFRISPKSFYQVNPEQTEVLYQKAIEYAALTGSERVIDAYCGIGTIGIAAAGHAKEVIGVESNADAVRDAITNAKLNHVDNIRFYRDDAGTFLTAFAAQGEHADVAFLDPPRAGCSEDFLAALIKAEPDRIVYISCNPETQERDLKLLAKKYRPEEVQPVDLFPFTEHVETICLLSRDNR